jgi:hypothetical protein
MASTSRQKQQTDSEEQRQECRDDAEDGPEGHGTT